MRLIQVRISGYKHLKDVAVQFSSFQQNRLFHDCIPIRFFIGLNGSGKSAFLEGLCLLFSRIVQDEVPGFNFLLEYEIVRVGKLYRVSVTNGTGREKLLIRVLCNGEPLEPLHSFTQHDYLLPDYVFTCASGNNNNFFDIIVRSPQTSLYSDLFDESFLGKSRKDITVRQGSVEKSLRALRKLAENPICVFIDEQAATLALCAFLAVFPNTADARRYKDNISARHAILSMLESSPRPVSFSLTLDARYAAAFGDEVEKYGEILANLEVETGSKRKGNGWDTLRLYQDEALDTAESHSDIVRTFLFEPCSVKDEDVLCVKELTQAYGDPMKLLSKLILARNKGLIKDVHISFAITGTEDIVEENALSEGEYMLLVRLGLLAMGNCRDDDCQCLYLLDEPDVYLNERWNIDFVSVIHQIQKGTESQHEIIVATHSSLILTDAFPDQLYYFHLKDGQVQCHNILASTFGGSRNEIMQALFHTEHAVGSFSYARVEELLENVQSAEELELYIDSVGSGYLRLRLLDKLYRLREQRGE